MAKRQTQIPGTERPTIPELDELCAPYAEALYQRMELQKGERDLKKQINERMKQLKVKTYVFYDDDDNGYEVVRERGDHKVKFRKLKPDDDASPDSDDDEE